MAPLLLPLVGEGGRAGAKRRRGRMRGAGRSAARQAGTSVSAPSTRMKKTKFFIHALSASHIIGPSLSREPGAHRVSGRAAVPGRSRGGNAAGNFHPRPGPVSRLPRTGRGHRGRPDDRARPPAGVKSGRPQVGEKPTIWLFERGTPGAIAEGWEGAIHLLYEALTQRPASRLLPTGRVL